jgi:hypothetical protein
MQTVKGGFSFVEFDSDPAFPNPVRIDQLLKAGTTFTPKTATETLADNTEASAGKAIDISIRSANVDSAAGSAYAALKTAEEAGTRLYFRAVKLLSESIVIHNCDTAWNEYVDSDISSLVNNVSYKQGTGSVELFSPAGSGPQIVMATAAVVKDLTTVKAIRFWFKTHQSHAAGDLKFLLDNTANCGSPLETLNFPAIAAGDIDVWKEITLILHDPTALGAIISIGLRSDPAVTVTDHYYIDNVRGVTGALVVFNCGAPKVVFESNETGKHNAIKITAEGFADVEANLLTTKF